MSYVLMGLLRRRPKVDPEDSAFQAFARLSLVNDSDKLLEKLICMLPKIWNDSWLTANDTWDINVWDIYPKCQIAGVGHDDTIILDGVLGASIRWRSFVRVATLRKRSWARFIAYYLLRMTPLILVAGVLLTLLGPVTSSTSGPRSSYFYLSRRQSSSSFSSPYFGTGDATVSGSSSSTPYSAFFGASSDLQSQSAKSSPYGAILLVPSLLAILLLPRLFHILYWGKLRVTQAWLFGFEGYMPLSIIEYKIFGSVRGRLSWSPSGSALSRHYANEYGECVGSDPTADAEVWSLVGRAKTCSYGEPRVFALVDTHTVTVTMFASLRPPTALLLCGQEGGMQRAVLCSCDWKSGTVYRETVLRMETTVLEKMHRVRRVRSGFERPSKGHIVSI